MTYRSYDDYAYKQYKAGKAKPKPNEIWREASLNAIEAVMSRLAGKSDFKTMGDVIGVNANQVARNTGLSNLKDVSYYTKVSPTDLTKMYNSNPYMFIVLCYGIKHMTVEQPRLAGEIRRRIRGELEKK